MERVAFITFLLTAVFSFSACVPHQYHFVNKTVSWTEAQRFCRENYTDLATINNKNDIEELMKSVNDKSVLLVWIGLHKTENKTWKWSLGDPAIYTGSDSLYQKWGNDQSNAAGDCVYMKNGELHNNNCTDKNSFICYNASSKEYIFNSTQMNWRDAQSFCREKHTDLVSVRNQNENQTIQNIINNQTGNHNVWIGLFRDSWEWSDHSESSFRFWAPGEASAGNTENCTVISLNEPRGKYQDWHGDQSHNYPFVCHEDQLVLIKQNLIWNEALRYCRENHVDLVSVDSQQIQHHVMNVARNASTTAVWMGLRRSCIMGLWFWVNGEILCYQNWAAGNGTGQEDCSGGLAGAVQSGGDQTWISRPQTQQLNFICTN
ncbi:macrophage mannose receptor 1-like [Myxocyprinus asiaticus]|uniref:macrophage mannose receptor 1-like n=1 Tax=Myxocyprinus asiaticus TaxID=70543 RepID=UPI002223E6C4|nr:macrophage mannose receptor 1-like [Myxocyprinus asiaticus]XP_051555742.1 macrophage mannose receptor 1-like [Myxocyprinus asiaticus]